jgi:hypothetical protein
MKRFYADGEGYRDLVNDDGKIVGYCPLKRPHFSIECSSIDEAINAPIGNWDFEGDAGGNYEFYDDFDPSEDNFNTDGMTITDIYIHTIEEL